METQEFASKGVGTAGLTLGIIGTALAGLVGGNGGNGILGNLFGGNNNIQDNQIASLMAEIGRLKGEKYTDQAILKQRDIEADINAQIAEFSLQTEKRLALLEATAPLREQLLQQQIACLTNTVNSLATTVAGITKIVVPITAVCPTPAVATTTTTA